MQWAEEMLVETSKARATIEKSYHKINKVITAIDDKLILPAGLAIDSGKAAAAPDKPATKKKAKGKAKTADKGKTPRKRQTSVAEDGYKVCFTCGKKLSVDQFDKDKTKKDGLKHKCKSCVKAYREARKAG